MVAPFHIPPTMCKSFNFFTFSPVCIICPIHGHSSRDEGVSHCDLIYTLLLTNDVEHIFTYCISYLHVSLEEYLFKSFAPFFIELPSKL